jgi:hypothetical protein
MVTRYIIRILISLRDAAIFQPWGAAVMQLNSVSGALPESPGSLLA